MTTVDYTIMNYLEEAHGALVAAAKEAHLDKHPEAKSISRLIDTLEEIDARVCGDMAMKRHKA